jgi:uncharacterized coiled-coil DUF342 family protein
MNPQIQKIEQDLVDAYTDMDFALKEAQRYRQMSIQLLIECEKLRHSLNQLKNKLPK